LINVWQNSFTLFFMDGLKKEMSIIPLCFFYYLSFPLILFPSYISFIISLYFLFFPSSLSSLSSSSFLLPSASPALCSRHRLLAAALPRAATCARRRR